LRLNKKDMPSDVGYTAPLSPLSASDDGVAPTQPSRPRREHKKAVVGEAVLESSNEEDACHDAGEGPVLMMPPAIYKNQGIYYESLQAS
jgi:hypothetical protein